MELVPKDSLLEIPFFQPVTFIHNVKTNEQRVLVEPLIPLSPPFFVNHRFDVLSTFLFFKFFSILS